MGEFVDLASWKFRDHFQFFKGFANPFFSVTAEVDVTAAWRRSREPNGPSFFLRTLFAALHAANSVEAMRLRLRDGGVWRHDRIAVSTTVAREDETFGFARMECVESLEEFVECSTRELHRAKHDRGLVETEVDDAVMFHSTLPWLRFTSFTNPLPLGGDSIPRIVFGRTAGTEERMTMPVAVEVHHAVVQGFDLGRYFEELQSRLSS